MSSFFQGQMDYIFFFYGLAFVGLGVVSYFLSNDAGQRLPWKWLALFGFTHGLNEWLDLLALSWPEGLALTACRWAVMTLSFFFLVEFGHYSRMPQRGQRLWPLVLGVLALAAALGALSGWSGLNATCRYTLGLVGSLWAAWALIREARRADSRGRPWLLAGGAGLILYGLATGLVVPPAAFFPATLVNYETFAKLTGLPIQLVRGLSAVGITAMMAGYFQVSWRASSEPSQRYRACYMYGIGAALTVILVAGWVMTQSLGNLAWEQVRKDSLSQNKIAIQRLAFEVGQAEEAVQTMAGSPWLRPTLWERSPQTLAQANSVLDRYQQRFEASVVYLMDSSGTTIASSNRAARDSFVGKSYGFRPYFKEAMQGKTGRYLALGVTSKKRGFYASFPVRDQEGKIAGVAVFKMTMGRFQQDLREFDPAFLVDPQGIVFLSSRPNLDYHGLWPVSAAKTAGFKAQYGTDHFTPIFSRPIQDNSQIKFAGREYLVTRQNIEDFLEPGWTMVNLVPTSIIVHYRNMGIVAAFLLVVLTLVFAGTNLSIRESANRIQASEARFRAMFDAAPEAVFVFDPKTRKILDANPFMTRWLGYGPEELIGLEIDRLMERESEGAQEEGLPGGPEGQGGVPARRYRRQDGSLVDVELTMAQILHEGQVRELVFVRDVTARQRAESQLKKERDFISTLLDTVGALVMVLDPQGRIVRFNRSCEQVSGHSAAEVEGHPIWDFLIPPEEVQGVKEVFETLLTDSMLGEHENYWISRDGQRRLIAWSNTSLKDAEGRVTHVIGTGIDVTARRRAENDLRQAKESLENILDNSADPIGIVDSHGRIIKWNKACARIFGYSFDELEGKSSFELYADPKELEVMLAQLRRDGSVRGYEIQMKKKAGIAPFALSISLLYDRDQKVIGSVCVARDRSEIKKTLDDLATVNKRLQHEVNERKQMEAALQETNRRLQGVVAQVEERNRAMSLANEMADILQTCQISEEAYEAIAHFMPQFFPNSAGALYMLNNSRNLFEAVATWGKAPPAQAVFTAEECWSVRRGRLHKVDRPQEALLCQHVTQDIPDDYLCVPLIAQGETLGVFHLRLGHRAEGQVAGLATAEEQLALAVAEDLALSLANLKLRETLRSQAIRDPLTGLFNRRYMEETMERELNRVKRQGMPLGVIMMDLDYFKQYNDTYGHNAGDDLLSALGSLVKSQIREEDIACRYGGEEFLLIMSGASVEVTMERAEMLRQAIKEMHLHYRSLKPITVSLGVAVYPYHGNTSLQLIRTADAALYQAKQEGRDRIVLAEYTGEPDTTKLPTPTPYRLEAR
jgi:diguanylate cyclase (GGDEF)-like protein/PAS domain S-box-containing protein